VGRNAYDEELVALELLRRLQVQYAPLLEARYKLESAARAWPSMHDDELLAAIGRKRGAIMSGGRVNLQKASEIVLTDFRSAMLGRITLETPARVRGLAGRRCCWRTRSARPRSGAAHSMVFL
jgi:ribosome biogenesis GTPase A